MFLVLKIALDISKINKKNRKEICSKLVEKGKIEEDSITVYINNFYDFNQDKNIVGIKQRVTYRISNPRNFNEFLEELEKK